MAKLSLQDFDLLRAANYRFPMFQLPKAALLENYNLMKRIRRICKRSRILLLALILFIVASCSLKHAVKTDVFHKSGFILH